VAYLKIDKKNIYPPIKIHSDFLVDNLKGILKI